jgi:probable F420-dependent oxidoreductase
VELSGVGVWSGALRYGDAAARGDAAAELESLGYTALWLPGGAGGDVFGDCRVVLDATERIPVATGILNLWMHDAAAVATGHAGLTAAHPGRFLLGIGISHSMLVDSQEPGTYARPLATTREYLDALDAASPPVPIGERALAALGPKMLELARDRTAGSHPYLVNPEHTAQARAILGGKGLFVEQGVVLETDADKARQIARTAVAIYTGLPNYVNNWKRLGYSEDEILNTSDRFIDEIFVWGDADAIGERIEAHRAAGADHVCIQALSAEGVPAVDTWRALRR